MAENIGKVIKVSGPQWTCSLKKDNAAHLPGAARHPARASSSHAHQRDSRSPAASGRGARAHGAMEAQTVWYAGMKP